MNTSQLHHLLDPAFQRSLCLEQIAPAITPITDQAISFPLVMAQNAMSQWQELSPLHVLKCARMSSKIGHTCNKNTHRIVTVWWGAGRRLEPLPHHPKRLFNGTRIAIDVVAITQHFVPKMEAHTTKYPFPQRQRPRRPGGPIGIPTPLHVPHFKSLQATTRFRPLP
jgi:hypothetical protein